MVFLSVFEERCGFRRSKQGWGKLMRLVWLAAMITLVASVRRAFLRKFIGFS